MGNRKMYRRIAKDNGVSIAEVKQEIQAAITAAYTDPSNQNEIVKLYQKSVPCKGKIPTPDELIRYATHQIHKY